MRLLKICLFSLSLFFSQAFFAQTCDSLGVEYGWGMWRWQTANPGNPAVFTNPPSLNPPSPEFNLTTGSGIDSCTPGPNIGDPVIPVVCTGFGYTSIQINGYACNCAERLTHLFTVSQQDTNFAFAYAIYIEDPSHSQIDQPNVRFCMYDSSGSQIPNACFAYTASSSLPGFYTSNCIINSVSYYKPWTNVSLNLSSYIGQTITIEIINSDCSLGGHFARSYWDFWCGSGLVGIEEENNLSFEVLPSVSSSGFFSIKNNSEIKQISVLNLTGESIYSEKLLNKVPVEINLSDKPNGIYFLHLKTDSGVVTKKVVIMK